MVVGGAFFKSGKVVTVQTVGGVPSYWPGIAFVKLQAHTAVNAGLGLVDEGLHGFAFRRKPESVIDGGGIPGHDLGAYGKGFAVQAQALQILMGYM